MTDPAKPLGVWEAFEQLRTRPPCDPPGLDRIATRNRESLCRVVRLIHIMARGVPGTGLFLGTDSLGDCFGVHAMVALRWLKQLVALGVITRTWTGGLCRINEWGEPYKKNLVLVKDANGKPYPAGAMAPRASEYVYNGTEML